jgi:hypothetical protein
MVGLLALAGLVVDGGAALAAKHRALGDARSAARAGASALAAPALRRAGTFTLDAAAVEAAARSFLVGVGREGEVTVAGDRVEVRVRDSAPTTFLGLIGLRELHVQARGVALALHGIASEEGTP